MTYLEATDREDGEKRSAETSPDENAGRNNLGCQLINSDHSLHSNGTTNMEYASITWGTAAKINKNRVDKVQNTALRVILGAMNPPPSPLPSA